MKRLIATIALLLALCTVITACGRGDGYELPTDSDTDASESHDTQEQDTESETQTPPPVINFTDVWKIAMTKAGFSDLSGMSHRAIGYGAFQNYSDIHANPLKAATYPLDLTALAAKVGGEEMGVFDFSHTVMKQYGFEKDFFDQTQPEEGSLAEALAAMWCTSGNTPLPLEEFELYEEKLTTKTAKALTAFLFTVAKALELNFKATASVDDDLAEQLFNYSRCIPATSDPSSLANAYACHLNTSEEDLLRAGLMVVYATEKLAVDLRGETKLTVDGAPLTIITGGAGDILLGSRENDVYRSPKSLLILDPAGDDLYMGCVAASRSRREPISVVIDFGGNDRYRSTSNKGATQGSGVLGTGVLFDLGGNDAYSAIQMAQASSLIGTGVLYDSEGDDNYFSKVSSQASAYYGFSLLADGAGDDRYDAIAFAQASAGNRGMAFLTDTKGDDFYFVEPYEVVGYEDIDYGQYPDVNGNWSQGCGMGQRNISTEERGLSGGIAGLMDHDGNDTYEGGIWVQGTGYWSGVGFLCDVKGNDLYDSKYYSQASVAHYGVGSLVDLGGDDRHVLEEEQIHSGQGASIGFTWDRGVAMFIDDGGNDTYFATQTCFGASWSAYDDKGPLKQDRNYAFFIDTEGVDSYTLEKTEEPCFGYGLGGFFFDLEGEDSYNASGYRNDRFQKNKGGVICDFSATETERAQISFWESAKERFYNKLAELEN